MDLWHNKAMTILDQFHLALQQQSLMIIALSFLGGVASTFLPCTIAMMPILIGYISGFGDTTKKTTLLLQILFFIIGLGIVMAILGTLASLLGLTFGSWVGPPAQITVGIVAILIAANMLEWFHLPTLPGLSKLPEFKQRNGFWFYLSPMLLGMAFGVASSPCGTPFLAGILAFISQTHNVALGAVSLFAYAIGQGALLILIGLFTGLLKQMAQLRAVGHHLSRLSALVFLLLGIGFLIEGLGLFPESLVDQLLGSS